MATTPKKPSAAKRKAVPKAEPLLHCGFCGLDQEHVAMLVRGESDACICGECVELARDIVGARRLGILPEDGPVALK